MNGLLFIFPKNSNMKKAKTLYTFRNVNTNEIILRDIMHQSIIELLEEGKEQNYMENLIEKGTKFNVRMEDDTIIKYEIEEVKILLFASVTLLLDNLHSYNSEAIIYVKQIK